MLACNGVVAVAGDPQLKITPANTGKGMFLNFRVVSEGHRRGEEANYQYWDMAMWVPEQDVKKWEEQLAPGSTFYVEHAYATSYPVQEGKFHNTVIRVTHDKVRRFEQPAWVKR